MRILIANIYLYFYVIKVYNRLKNLSKKVFYFMTEYINLINTAYKPSFVFSPSEATASDLCNLPEELLVKIIALANQPNKTTLVCRQMYRVTVEVLKQKFSRLLPQYGLFSRKVDELAKNKQPQLPISEVVRDELKMQKLEELIHGTASLSFKELTTLLKPLNFKEALIESLAVKVRYFTKINPNLFSELKSDEEFQTPDLQEIIQSSKAFILGEVYVNNQFLIEYRSRPGICRETNINGRTKRVSDKTPFISVMIVDHFGRDRLKQSSLPMNLFVDLENKNFNRCLEPNFTFPCINAGTVVSFNVWIHGFKTRFKLICREAPDGPYQGKTITEAVNSEFKRVSESMQKEIVIYFSSSK